MITTAPFMLLLFVAGGMGTLLRYLAVLGVAHFYKNVFPLGTLAVNILGCTIIGSLSTFARDSALISQSTYLISTIGFLGGFTTFSAFGMETFIMLDRQHYGWALLYVLGSLAGGLCGVGLGRSLAHALTAHITPS